MLCGKPRDLCFIVGTIDRNGRLRFVYRSQQASVTVEELVQECQAAQTERDLARERVLTEREQSTDSASPLKRECSSENSLLEV